MPMIICEECGKEYSDKAKQCPACGAPPKFVTCTECGEKVSAKASSCPKCGCPLSNSSTPIASMPMMAAPVINITNSNDANNSNAVSQETKQEVKQEQTVIQQVGGFMDNIGGRGGRECNKWISFILCVCFGYFGAHKFYEGRNKMGIIYLFTIGLFGIGWILDCIIIFFKPNPYYT